MSATQNPIQPILAMRLQSAVALGISLRMLDYLIAQRLLETRRLGRRNLVVYKSLLQFARHAHPFVGQKHVSPDGPDNAPEEGAQ